MRDTRVSIGELSRRTGCNIETIRYYERIGVLPPPDRVGRYRRFADADIRRLGFVRRARELGFTLDEVRALLQLSQSDGRSACGDVRRISAAHLSAVRARIADLRAMERVLAETIRECGSGAHSGCPLIDALGGNSL